MIKVGDWVHNIHDNNFNGWDGEVVSIETILCATIASPDGLIERDVENLAVIDKSPAEPPVGSIVRFKGDQTTHDYTTHVHATKGWVILYAHQGVTGVSAYPWDLTLRDYGTEFIVLLEGA